MIRALIASSIVGIICPLIGIFIVLKRLSLIGDSLSHIALSQTGRVMLQKILEDNSIVGIYLPVGVGLKWKLGERWQLQAAWQHNVFEYNGDGLEGNPDYDNTHSASDILA